MSLLPLLLAFSLGADAPLATTAERSGFRRTGRYAEVETLCAELQSASPERVRCERFGTTPEGRPMLLLVASADGLLDAEKNRAAKRPVLLFQGGIHAGESDGKDAGFIVLRELLEAKSGPLDRATVLFLPVLNVDGHERFGPNHRPNQRGPEEMGFRVTGQNLNLNRDYLKADSPELQQLLPLLHRWDPILYADLHVTDGAKFEPDVAVLIEPMQTGPQGLAGAAGTLRDALFSRLTKQGHLPLPFYPSFERNDDPASGFAAGVPPPRFSNGYWALRNRLGILVETHSWRDYAHRVRTTADVMRGLIALGAQNGAAWLAAARRADEETTKLSGELPLSWEAAGKPETLEFPGYAWRRVPSDLSGQLRVIYDEQTKELWRIPYLSKVQPKERARVPKAYLVPAAHAGWVGEKLALHGIRFERLEAERTAEFEAFRAAETRFRPEPYEGRQMLQVTGAWKREKRPLGRGSLRVPVAQPLGRLVVHLFEPNAPDSLLAWGYFNAHFEQKEYMEDYVTEEEARRMLAAEPALAKAFAAKLEDPGFARDPKARLRFFYERHPAFDERFRLYPVLRE